MSTYLLDTNVIWEITRPRPNQDVLDFFSSTPSSSLYIPSVVLAEIRYGISLLDGSERRTLLQDWLDQTIRPLFADRVAEVTEDVLVRWRVLVQQGRRAGYTYPEPDLLIAAIATERGMTVVTRNIADFERAGVPVLNPWR